MSLKVSLINDLSGEIKSKISFFHRWTPVEIFCVLFEVDVVDIVEDMLPIDTSQDLTVDMLNGDCIEVHHVGDVSFWQTFFINAVFFFSDCKKNFRV